MLKSDNIVANDFAIWLSQLQEIMKFHLQEIQDCYKAFAKKLKNESLLFYIGDKTWLIWEKIKTIQLRNKFNYQRLVLSYIQRKVKLVVYD